MYICVGILNLNVQANSAERDPLFVWVFLSESREINMASKFGIFSIDQQLQVSNSLCLGHC